MIRKILSDGANDVSKWNKNMFEILNNRLDQVEVKLSKLGGQSFETTEGVK